MSCVETTVLYDSEHITYVLHQNACGIGHIVQVALGKIRQAGAGNQVEMLEGGVEALAQAGVEIEQRGVAVDNSMG
ncbi:rhodanese-related sulfurtransferase [Pseudomonas sp. W4I3]|nr:rhodanese-related sulfurtransferase [Pseudomonas sp. W4I3]